VAVWVLVACIDVIWSTELVGESLRHKVAFVFVAIAFPHNEGGGFGISHGTLEGVWGHHAGSLGGETHSLSVFEIGDFVVDDLVDITGGSVSESHGEA